MQKAYTFDDVLIIPKYSTVNSRSEVDLTVHIGRYTTLKLPVICANMPDLVGYDMAHAMHAAGGIACLPRFDSVRVNVDLLRHLRFEGVPVWVSVGVTDGEQTRLDRLVFEGANVVCIDVAHGNQRQVLDFYSYNAIKYPDVDFILGNVISPVYSSSNPILKVGIGPGSVCTTRVKTGCGYPQLSAVLRTARKETGRKPGNIVIADGGIKTPGDAAKALAAGAHAVMIGGMLAGTDMAANKFSYGGSASAEAYVKQGKDTKHRTAEGETFAINGRVKKTEYVLNDIAGGLRSALAYVGARNLEEFWRNAEFVEVTANGVKENGAHYNG